MFTGGFFFYKSFYVHYSTPLRLPPLRFHCVGGCWDRTHDCCDFGIDSSHHLCSTLCRDEADRRPLCSRSVCGRVRAHHGARIPRNKHIQILASMDQKLCVYPGNVVSHKYGSGSGSFLPGQYVDVYGRTMERGFQGINKTSGSQNPWFHAVLRIQIHRIHVFLGLLRYGSGSGSGSGSFYHLAKMVRKPWFLLFCDFFLLFTFEIRCKNTFKKYYADKLLKKNLFFVGILKVNDENRGIRIH